MLMTYDVNVLGDPLPLRDLRGRLSMRSLARLSILGTLCGLAASGLLMIFVFGALILTFPLLLILVITFFLGSEWMDLFWDPLSPISNKELNRMRSLAQEYPQLGAYMDKLDTLGRAPVLCEYYVFCNFPDNTYKTV